ncbi:AtrD, ABC-transporter [Leptodontidium sp. MPI-SDFR-AT-0119]|nr:AtrD, ABC-transporter [Leptodontidium sp. MPI-SDFR-AT-0119]
MRRMKASHPWERIGELEGGIPLSETYERRTRYEQWLHGRALDQASFPKHITGVMFRNLTVYAFGASTDCQQTVSSYPISFLKMLLRRLRPNQENKIDILRGFDGVVRSGEMLLVLGKPGSGCTTLLRTLAGHTRGLRIDSDSDLSYQGNPSSVMHSEFRGECNYHTESNAHFPNLTVKQTLAAAAKARTPANPAIRSRRKQYCRDTINATSTALRLSHAMNTKRTGIAEVLVCDAGLQCWDNSTRGLDSNNARNFINVLKMPSTSTGSVHVATLYQASQDMYNTFDKVTLLYKGRQIFFGPARYECPNHATTLEFLVSLTSRLERTQMVIEGFENKVPVSPDEFALVWLGSKARKEVLEEMKRYDEEFPPIERQLERQRLAQKSHKSSWQRAGFPYTILWYDQVHLCLISGIAGNAIISIILGSVFYNLAEDTSSFYGRGVLIFFTVLMNTFLGNFEGTQLWAQRPIVERHFQYALYHPAAEAIASMLCDIPNKLMLTAAFNVPFYFMANMRRTPETFTTFYVFAFAILLVGSMLFRTIGAMSRTLTESIAPGAVFVLLLVIYTGFALPVPSMHPWLRWFAYINPIAYAFESLMINEFSGRQFPCKVLIPDGDGYENVDIASRICSVGALPGSLLVDGDEYLANSFQYHQSHIWRNLGIIFALGTFLCSTYLIATECISSQGSKDEVLIFRQGHQTTQGRRDEETPLPIESRTTTTKKMGSSPPDRIFAAYDICYDVKVKDGTKRILENVEGWVKPGTLTAIMGASGAGKTTLLNILANRTTTGVISGEKFVDAKFRGGGFARQVGYAQQQDLHLPTSTVREALIFSARLRQPKLDHLIETLAMEEFAEAVIGVPGEGLNTEQRKRLTICVELAARPELLLFLDEPTSGLDNNTAWSICTLLRKLANEGQSILCTIHQPSSPLLQMFDRLLLLREGKSIYFGDIGRGCRTLIDYFESNGARNCETNENTAKWLLDITENSKIPWSQIWSYSDERRRIKQDLAKIKARSSNPPDQQKGLSSSEFVTIFGYQLYIVTQRCFENNWRTPSNIYSKVFLTLGAAIVNEFSFYHSQNSLQGLQNQIFSTFILLTLHSNLVQITMPQFLANRDLYEIRERPSRTYSWAVFVLSNIIAELPWQVVLATIQFSGWYYPVGMYRNAETTGSLAERSGLMFLSNLSFFFFSSTFSQMLGTIMPDASTGVNISSLLYSLSLIFCGVLVPFGSLPKFWLWLYHSTPVTYFVRTMLSTGIAGARMTRAANELLYLNPPTSQTCAFYLNPYLNYSGGHLLNPDATSGCQLCPMKDVDTFLVQIGVHFSKRWEDFGISLIYTAVNILGALALYWIIRGPRRILTRDTR